MDKRKIIILAVAATVLLTCIGGVLLWVTQSGNDLNASETTSGTEPEDSGILTSPTVPIQPSDPTIPTNPTEPLDPANPTDSEVPTDPTNPIDPTNPTDSINPTDPDVPADPDLPKEEPEVHQKVEFFVTREDGSAAHGAAIIATDSNGQQQYGVTNEKGEAVMYLMAGKYSVRLLQDGQNNTVELEVGNELIKQKVQLEDDRKLYVLFVASGGYNGDPSELVGFSVLQDAIKSQYPNAVYITSEERYDIDFYDGDALLSVEILVENYTANDQYFASEVCVSFATYQESITVWNMDEAGIEIDMEYLDGNMCSIQVRNEYDYEYQDSSSVITESKYIVQSDWHLCKYSDRADAWGYGYTTESVLSTSKEEQLKAPGAGMKTEAFWFDINSNRFREYLPYAQELFPYVDLWMSGNWNADIEQLTSA